MLRDIIEPISFYVIGLVAAASLMAIGWRLDELEDPTGAPLFWTAFGLLLVALVVTAVVETVYRARVARRGGQ